MSPGHFIAIIITLHYSFQQELLPVYYYSCAWSWVRSPCSTSQFHFSWSQKFLKMFEISFCNSVSYSRKWLCSERLHIYCKRKNHWPGKNDILIYEIIASKPFIYRKEMFASFEHSCFNLFFARNLFVFAIGRWKRSRKMFCERSYISKTKGGCWAPSGGLSVAVFPPIFLSCSAQEHWGEIKILPNDEICWNFTSMLKDVDDDKACIFLQELVRNIWRSRVEACLLIRNGCGNQGIQLRWQRTKYGFLFIPQGGTV